jgi:hypothetical protein
METLNELLETIQGRIDEVEQALVGSTGGRSMCQLHKDGAMTGGMKYYEATYCPS